MKKLRRSARLVDMTQYLLAHPHTLIPLTLFSEEYGSAKSSISEDLSIIKEAFESEGVGVLKTVAGAAGGVKFIPQTPLDQAERFMKDLIEQLEKPERLLPGGYLYMSDILGNPSTLGRIGKLFATAFADKDVEVVMTVETKGIPLAYATAAHLNVPVVIVRRDNKVTEGSVVSINYVSGSSKRIQTMSLARRALAEQSRVLIVDDFMKAGGTIQGMIDLLQEFRATVVGCGVLVETADVTERLVDEYVSLSTLRDVDLKEKQITIDLGSYFTKEGKETK